MIQPQMIVAMMTLMEMEFVTKKTCVPIQMSLILTLTPMMTALRTRMSLVVMI
jgi:hypothetical protein